MIERALVPQPRHTVNRHPLSDALWTDAVLTVERYFMPRAWLGTWYVNMMRAIRAHASVRH